MAELGRPPLTGCLPLSLQDSALLEDGASPHPELLSRCEASSRHSALDGTGATKGPASVHARGLVWNAEIPIGARDVKPPLEALSR